MIKEETKMAKANVNVLKEQQECCSTCSRRKPYGACSKISAAASGLCPYAEAETAPKKRSWELEEDDDDNVGYGPTNALTLLVLQLSR